VKNPDCVYRTKKRAKAVADRYTSITGKPCTIKKSWVYRNRWMLVDATGTMIDIATIEARLPGKPKFVSDMTEVEVDAWVHGKKIPTY
jgi:hypothetical protein